MKKKIKRIKKQKQKKEIYLIKELLKEKDTTDYQRDVLKVYLESLKWVETSWYQNLKKEIMY